MLRTIKQNSAVWLVILGLAAGYVAARFAAAPLHATATHSTDNITVATGFLDQRTEVFISLDHLTGEMTGLVIAANTGKFLHRYEYANLNTDLGVGAAAKPKYSMVTGLHEFVRGGGPQMANMVIYVTEETTGNVAAYTVPWNPALRQGQGQKAAFILLDVGKATSGIRRGGAGGTGM